MLKKLLCVLLAAMMLLSLTACKEPQDETQATTAPQGTTAAGETTVAPTEPDLPYAFGLGETFKADAPVTYSMFFSDASWYAFADTWETEGVFKKITDLTNVKLDVTKFDSGTYMDSVTLAVSGGEAAYIIPKIYDESKFITGGAVLAVSDYVQYMPYYQDFVTKYAMEPDLATITRADGKYYRLPGMLEAPLQDYTLMIRNDIFKAAGYDVAALEKDWTWNDLCDILVGVKAYMVQEGMCKEGDYIWSDLWAGTESGQGNGGNILKLIGASYGVPSGWAVGNGLQYDAAKDEWYFAATTDQYKDFITVANRFIKEGILDPESFTQDDKVGPDKFYNGKTAIISVNRSQVQNFRNNLDSILGAGNHETYVCVYPKGNNDFIAERNRLENGVMISSNALDDLGEEGVIQLFRFVDWLFYSPEAYTLIKWGVEGETFEYVTDAATGLKVKQLLPGFKCGGLGIGGADEDVDIRLQWGYAGGVFWYGGTVAEMSDNFSPEIIAYYDRLGAYRKVSPINPPVQADTDQSDQLSLMQTPLIDKVNEWTLRFVMGKDEMNDDNWNKFVGECESLGSEEYAAFYNEIYKG